MQAKVEDEAKVRGLCERLYGNETISDEETSFLETQMRRPLTGSVALYALEAVRFSSMEHAEEVVVRYLDTSNSREVIAKALNVLCKMGFCKKYRQIILTYSQPKLSDQGHPHREASAALFCMGLWLRSNKDREFAEVIRNLLALKDHLPSAATPEASLVICAQLAAANAVGADNWLAAGNLEYCQQCVRRFISERGAG